MLSFLKLIRVQNLLIIAFTQYMVRYCIIIPSLGKQFIIGDLRFFLLSLSTVMIAAAGYIINDYFDVKIDKVNKPERMVIDKGVKRRVAIGAHTVINILAIAIAFALSLSVGAWKLSLIYVIAATGLWLYSTTFKKKFLIGNIVIALFTALVPFVVGLYGLIYFEPFSSLPANAYVTKLILQLSFFAFMTTLLREIIKDVEDMEGDREFGCKTMPIVLGVKSCKRIVIVLSLATMACLGYIQFKMIGDFEYYQVHFYYFLFALQLPFLFLIWKTWKAKGKKDFRFAGNTAKLIMLLGVCYLFIHAHSILSAI